MFRSYKKLKPVNLPVIRSFHDFQRHLDCPMSTSISLCRLVDNNVWTRSVMIGADVDVPVSLNFLYKCQPLSLIADPILTVIWLDDKLSLEEISEQVKTFVNQPYVTSKKVNT